MPPVHYDLDAVTRLATGTVGPVGQRTFYVQVRQGETLITLVAEKEQVQALGLAFEEILGQLNKSSAEATAETSEPVHATLEEPLEPLFHIGQLGLVYDEKRQMLVLVFAALAEDPEAEPPTVVRAWVTPAQMRAFSHQAAEVIAAGRPICHLCGGPINPEGHICPKKNGHALAALQ